MEKIHTFEVIPFLNRANMNGRVYTVDAVKKLVSDFKSERILKGFGYPEHGEMFHTMYAKEYDVKSLYLNDNDSKLCADVVFYDDSVYEIAQVSALRPMTIGVIDDMTGEISITSFVGLFFVNNDAFNMTEDVQLMDEGEFSKKTIAVSRELMNLAREITKDEEIQTIIPKSEDKVICNVRKHRLVKEQDTHSYKITIEKIPFS